MCLIFISLKQSPDPLSLLYLIQNIQEIRTKLSNLRNSDSVAEEKADKAAYRCLPKVDELVREKIPDKQIYGSSYKPPVLVLGVDVARIIALLPLPGAKNKQTGR